MNPCSAAGVFIPQTLDKLREVRRRIDASGYDIGLEVDGGEGEQYRRDRSQQVRCLLRVGNFDKPDYKSD